MKILAAHFRNEPLLNYTDLKFISNKYAACFFNKNKSWKTPHIVYIKKSVSQIMGIQEIKKQLFKWVTAE